MSRPKILLADDSITIQKVVNLTFADQGMDVITFSDGDAAVENLDEVRPDIVLADVNMPGINGYQLCELMRSDDANKDIPVILLVGSFEPFDRDEAARVGSSAHLTKPFTSIAELVSTVQRLLEERSSAILAEDEGSVFDEASDVSAGPAPDTSDIDSLYHQSFVETVELPRSEMLNGEFGNGIDDEMIQTSYAEADPEPLEEEAYFSADLSSELASYDSEVSDAESLIAQSMPEESDIYDGSADAEPVEHTFADPFESVAGEVPPVPVSEDVSRSDTISFNFDDDLLELPGGASRPAAITEPAAPSQQITSLSPELIDLIVEKVVERLAKKY